MKSRSLLLLLVAALIGLSPLIACADTSRSNSGTSHPLEALYTLQADANRTIVRAITKADSCPKIQFDKRKPEAMVVRAAPATIPARGDNKQPITKDAEFDLVCETPWRQGAKTAQVAGQKVPAPKPINRIAIVSDTGCRMKASDNGFQACNDPAKWPFAQVAQSAAALKPDLVIHLGDINYRESPCPVGNSGCADTAWGYGNEGWAADLFTPAKPLLAAAPWLFVRGNHESCWRAGQGWFRFLDVQPWAETRSCNAINQDAQGDFSDPYTVNISPNVQLIVFDSSRVPSAALSPQDPAFQKYAVEIQQVATLSQQKPISFFLSHHPVLAFGLPEKGEKLGSVRPGNAVLQNVMKITEPARLLPAGVNLNLNGHIHLFESLSFSTPHPATMVFGNSGSLNEGGLPSTIPAGVEPYPGAVVEDFATMADFGFATLDRADAQDESRWTLTEYKADGSPVYRCDIVGSKSRCTRL